MADFNLPKANIGGVVGTGSGIPRSNRLEKKVEPLISVDKLKSVYLFGIDIIDNNGVELPEETFQQYIDNAVGMLETYLDISILPEQVIEDHDYHFDQYFNWGYLQLNTFPVIELKSLTLTYLRDNQGVPENVFEFPNAWIRLNNNDGLIRLVPNGRFPGSAQLDAGGAYNPYLLFTQALIPDVFRVEYLAGFADGRIPIAINQAISYMAAIQALIIGGNLVLGAGIGSSSLSIDGLSQSINTTQSAENSAYSATITEYSNQLYGSNERERGLLKTLMDYYKGQAIDII